MHLPGFAAEASVYTTKLHYSTRMAAVVDARGVYAALVACPSKCVDACIQACKRDGNSAGFCGGLCQKDCSAYTAGLMLGCGPCVNNSQTCTVCGGGTVTISCGLASCGNQVCKPGEKCCFGLGCCPQDANCCSDGQGCCPSGQKCESIDYLFGTWYFCLPDWL
jgi:hypothetical protein